jgi:hypothetical protein
MNPKDSWYRASGRAAAVVLALSLSATAELGGTTAGVQADQQRLNATRSVTQTAAYAVHEIHTPNNSVIREFVAPGGKVFAVSYRGQFVGESNALLGSYSPQIALAMKTVHNGKHRGGPVNIKVQGVVYHATGHLRSYIVRAYVPASVPQGVTVEELR